MTFLVPVGFKGQGCVIATEPASLFRQPLHTSLGLEDRSLDGARLLLVHSARQTSRSCVWRPVVREASSSPRQPPVYLQKNPTRWYGEHTIWVFSPCLSRCSNLCQRSSALCPECAVGECSRAVEVHDPSVHLRCLKPLPVQRFVSLWVQAASLTGGSSKAAAQRPLGGARGFDADAGARPTAPSTAAAGHGEPQAKAEPPEPCHVQVAVRWETCGLPLWAPFLCSIGRRGFLLLVASCRCWSSGRLLLLLASSAGAGLQTMFNQLQESLRPTVFPGCQRVHRAVLSSHSSGVRPLQPAKRKFPCLLVRTSAAARTGTQRLKN